MRERNLDSLFIKSILDPLRHLGEDDERDQDSNDFDSGGGERGRNGFE